MLKRSLSDTIALIAMASALLALGVLWGIVAYHKDLFPVPQLQKVQTAIARLIDERQRPYYLAIKGGDELTYTADAERLAPGLVMLVGVTETAAGPLNFIRVVDRGGDIVHEWLPDWFRIWGDDGNFRKNSRPKTQPGALIHGAALTEVGDVVFNFEHLSTVRLSACGDVHWKLDNLGHHSVHIDEHGIIWVPAENRYASRDTGQQNHEHPLRSWTIQRISSAGEILGSTEVLDILRANDLLGLMHLSSLDNASTTVSGDTLHLNDIKTFPSALASTLFEPGDIMISLRNINTILVMDPETHTVKFQATGQFLRQHDPLFAADDRILVFDNRNLYPSLEPERPNSRILALNARTGETSIHYAGDQANPFFTNFMGKHQLLPNGNLMIASTKQGRAFEVAEDNAILWHYNNRVSDGFSGALTQATVLPEYMDRAFFTKLTTACTPAADP